MGKPEIRQEARKRQGTSVQGFRIFGDENHAVFEEGGEGLVQLAHDLESGNKCRIKCFWKPDSNRRKRSELLVEQQLATYKTKADALGGAPYGVLDALGPYTPFAVIMKNIEGMSWKNLKDGASHDSQYPPTDWPSLEVRATWAYGLATAVLQMEKRRFIHADLSAGNVMVTPNGTRAGDMTLVDFDSFVHPANPDLDSTCRGSVGYAAPEIWNQTSVKIGSDRVGLAILIQEFLVTGDPKLSPDEAFGWAYDQDQEICSLKGEAHPHFAKQYPPLAELVVRTLRASSAASRPSPDLWRPMLLALATGRSLRRKLLAVTINPHPLARTDFSIPFTDTQKSRDLSTTVFRIGAVLHRNSDQSVDAVVQPRSTIHAKDPSTQRWKSFESGGRIPLRPGVILFDPKGKISARIDGQEH